MRYSVLLAAWAAVVPAVLALPASTQDSSSSITSSNSVTTTTTGTAGEEACKKLGTWFAKPSRTRPPISPVVAQACLKAIPFDEEERGGLLEEMEYASTYLSLVDWVAQAPLPALEMPKFNLNSTLATMKKTKYSDMFTFYVDIYRAFGRMQDGHTIMKPSCANMISYYHDYPIVNIGDEIWTVRMEKADRNGDNKVDLRLTKQITKINDLDPIEYLLSLSRADRLMVQLQDPDARWNNLMAQYPIVSFQLDDPLPKTYGAFAFRDEWNEVNDALTLEFADGETVDVKWKAASSGRKIFSTPKGLSTYCMGKTSHEDMKWDEDEEASGLEQPSEIVGYPSPYSSNYDGIAMIFMDEQDPTGTTAVLRLSTFSEIGESYFGDYEDFDQDYYEYISTEIPKLKTKLGIKRLIIDVTGNDGGSPTYAKLIRQVLFTSAPDLHTPGRTKWNPDIAEYFAETIAADPDWDELEYRTPEGKKFKSAKALIGPQDVYGSQFMSLVSLRYETSPLKNVTLPDKNLWDADDVVVITNGICHSSCHIFVEAMTHPDVGVRTYAVGGRPGFPAMQSVGGTKGGGNKDLAEIDPWKLGTAPTFRTFMWDQVNVEDQYRDNDDDEKDGSIELPLQFRWGPACKKIPHTNSTINSIESLWNTVRTTAWDKNYKATKCDDVEEPEWEESETEEAVAGTKPADNDTPTSETDDDFASKDPGAADDKIEGTKPVDDDLPMSETDKDFASKYPGEADDKIGGTKSVDDDDLPTSETDKDFANKYPGEADDKIGETKSVDDDLPMSETDKNFASKYPGEADEKSVEAEDDESVDTDELAAAATKLGDKLNELDDETKDTWIHISESANDAGDDIKDKASELKDDVKEKLGETSDEFKEIKEEAESAAEDIKDKAGDLKDDADDKVEELKDGAEDVADDVADSIAAKWDELTSALNGESGSVTAGYIWFAMRHD